MFFVLSAAGLTILMIIVLTIRQVFFGIRPDKRSSLPTPPRALTTGKALPVLGHTRFFKKYGGALYKRFDQNKKDLICLPKRFTSKLGGVFSIFIWGQWRVTINGPRRAECFFKDESEASMTDTESDAGTVISKISGKKGLKPGWAFFTPSPLLGQGCLAMMKSSDKRNLKAALGDVLSHSEIIRFAPSIGALADQFIDDMMTGELGCSKVETKRQKKLNKMKKRGSIHPGEYDDRTTSDIYIMDTEHLRRFTLDIVDGPLFGLSLYQSSDEEGHRGKSSDDDFHSNPVVTEKNRESEGKRKNSIPTKSHVLTWMQRLKKGLLGFRFTVGGKWMQIWRCNEYGRAIQGRNSLMSRILKKHVAEQSELSNTERSIGYSFRDPLTTPNPLFTFATNLQIERLFAINSAKEDYVYETKPRRRFSDPQISSSYSESITPAASMDFMHIEERRRPITANVTYSVIDKISSSFGLETPLPFARSQSDSRVTKENGKHHYKTLCKGTDNVSLQIDQDICAARSDLDIIYDVHKKLSENESKEKALENVDETATVNLLDDLLSKKDSNNEGLSQSLICDMLLLLWMALDGASSWASMALHLLQHNQDAIQTVRNELYHIENSYGEDFLSHRALKDMKYLDALIYEAIRLCPPFCGGMWQTRKTVELTNDNIQVPAGTNIIFSDTTTHPFDLEKAWGKSPQNLTKTYPNANLYGFLPLDGLEIPLMVLQTKVLLAKIILRCDIKEANVPFSIAMKNGYKLKQFTSKRKLVETKKVKQIKKKMVYAQFSDDEDDEISFDNGFQETSPSSFFSKGENYNGEQFLERGMNFTAKDDTSESQTSFVQTIKGMLDEAFRIDDIDNLSEEGESSTASTALKIRSFESDLPDNLSLDQETAENKMMTREQSVSSSIVAPPSLSPYYEKQHQGPHHNGSALTPKTCWSWFTILPFPESRDGVRISSRSNRERA